MNHMMTLISKKIKEGELEYLYSKHLLTNDPIVKYDSQQRLGNVKCKFLTKDLMRIEFIPQYEIYDYDSSFISNRVNHFVTFRLTTKEGEEWVLYGKIIEVIYSFLSFTFEIKNMFLTDSPNKVLVESTYPLKRKLTLRCKNDT